jgi:phosphate transport system substrate-binding protein
MKFFDWALRNSRQTAIDLEYVPIPDSAVRLIGQAWAEQIRCTTAAPSGRPAKPLGVDATL